MDTKQLEQGTVLRFTNLDEFVDNDLKWNPSRGEAKPVAPSTAEARVRELEAAWKQIPPTYYGRLSYDYNEHTRMFDITHDGYGIAQSEDSEVAHGICTIINALLAKEPR